MMTDNIKKEIEFLEQKIIADKADIAYLRKKLDRARATEFEEDLRESGNNQLLQE